MDLNFVDLLNLLGCVLYLIMPSMILRWPPHCIPHKSSSFLIWIQAQGTGPPSCLPKLTPNLKPRSGALHQELFPVIKLTSISFSESPRPVSTYHRLVRGQLPNSGQVSPWREPQALILRVPPLPLTHSYLAGQFGRRKTAFPEPVCPLDVCILVCSLPKLSTKRDYG